jgi:hypothetical protein
MVDIMAELICSVMGSGEECVGVCNMNWMAVSMQAGVKEYERSLVSSK